MAQARRQQKPITRPDRYRRRKRAVAEFAKLIQNPKTRQQIGRNAKVSPKEQEKKYKEWVTKALKAVDLAYKDIPTDVHKFFMSLTAEELSGLAKLQKEMAGKRVPGLYEDIKKFNPPFGTLAKL